MSCMLIDPESIATDLKGAKQHLLKTLLDLSGLALGTLQLLHLVLQFHISLKA